jgi:hypothetical protein
MLPTAQARSSTCEDKRKKKLQRDGRPCYSLAASHDAALNSLKIGGAFPLSHREENYCRAKVGYANACWQLD